MPVKHQLSINKQLKLAYVTPPFFLAGGYDLNFAFAVYVYDTTTEEWSQLTALLPTPRDNLGCEVIDTANGKELIVFGGYK